MSLETCGHCDVDSTPWMLCPDCGRHICNTCAKPVCPKSRADAVNHPAHYNVGGIEVIRIIDDWGLGFSLGNALKYILRSPYKGNELEDLKKAQWYLNHALEQCEYSSDIPHKLTVEEVAEAWGYNEQQAGILFSIERSWKLKAEALGVGYERISVLIKQLETK